MIVIDPPQVKPYAPATQPIAFVNVIVQRDELNNVTRINYTPLDASKTIVPVDAKSLPGKLTPQQIAAFIAAKSQAGDTLDQDHSRRAIPIIAANLGLTGTVQ